MKKRATPPPPEPPPPPPCFEEGRPVKRPKPSSAPPEGQYGFGRDDLVKLGGHSSSNGRPAARQSRRSEGRIRFFDMTKGYGFITSNDQPGDIFFPRQALLRKMQDLDPAILKGMEVSFEVHIKEDGKPRADNVEQLAGVLPPAPPPPGVSKSGTLPGKIARFARQKGYGFIACAEASEDVFFLSSVLPKELASLDEVIGKEVDIEITINDQGKPRCKQMFFAPHRGFTPAFDGKFHTGVVVQEGVIVGYDVGKCFGFIRTDSLSEDVFFSKSELPRELQQFERREDFLDRRLEFEVRTMPDGKLRAERICLLPPPHRYGTPSAGMMPAALPPLPFALNTMPVGHIRKFDRQKGYGFIHSNSHPEDIFFLPSTLPKEMRDSDKLEGIAVSLEFYICDDGKPRATKVRPLPRGHDTTAAMPPFMPPMGFPMGMPPMPPPMGFPMSFMPMMPPVPPPVCYPPPPHGCGVSVLVGTIARWDASKGFGFIIPDPGTGVVEDVFCLKAELPPELRDATRDQLVGQRFEFDVKATPDGKLRAKNVAMALSRRGSPVGGSSGSRRSFGTILRFDAAKGYGFIASPDAAGKVFFLRTMLPGELQEADPEDLKDMEVSFELSMNEEGKPRANHIITVASQVRVQPGEVIRGLIVKFDMVKGYGFVKPDELGEDIFVLKSALPLALQSADRRGDIEGQRVEFEVQTMADGKMRAQRMTVVNVQEHRGANTNPCSLDSFGGSLDEQQLLDMEEFLEQRGGACDYDVFTRLFQGVKRVQLEDHFRIISKEGVPDVIELRKGRHQVKLDRTLDDQASSGADAGDLGEEAASENDEEPAITAGPGCQPLGVIRSYDAKRGFGYASCEGFEDIFFPRSALPTFFQGTDAQEMPRLVGVEVALKLSPQIEGGHRADQVTLLLRWFPGDNCWLLKRRR